MSRTSAPAVVIGGGLSGLIAAAYLARYHIPTLLLHEATELGGRARTLSRNGFYFNFGPHRLFGDGAAVAGFRELGIRLPAAERGPNGGFAICHGRTHTLPVGHCSLLATSILRGSAKLELARLLTDIPQMDLSELHDVPLATWLQGRVGDPQVHQVLLAMIRATTYSNEPQQLSASAGLQQLTLALRGPVLCVHGGWGTLVRALTDDVISHGTQIQCDASAIAIESHADHVRQVILANGKEIPCRAVIMATNPHHAHAVLGDAWTDRSSLTPVRVATLDIALSCLPQHHAVFALGIDVPVCVSADSVVARVAPPPGAVLHAAKYLRADEPGTGGEERELEELLDLVQPGWRPLVVHRRFFSPMTVSHGLVAAATGGFVGRPNGPIAGFANAFLAGDWVGPTGQLADAAVASALRAARATVRFMTAS
jgi:phytoene dehydrogenase-like protein